MARDRDEMKGIVKIMNEVLEGAAEKETEEFHRVKKHEEGKTRPLNITFQSATMTEEVLRSARQQEEEDKFKQEDKFKINPR